MNLIFILFSRAQHQEAMNLNLRLRRDPWNAPAMQKYLPLAVRSVVNWKLYLCIRHSFCKMQHCMVYCTKWPPLKGFGRGIISFMDAIYISPGHFSTFSVGCPFFSLKIRLAVQRLFWYETSPRIYRRESSEYTWIARKYHLLTDDGDEIQDGWKMRSTLYSMSEYNNKRLDREWYVLRIKICRKAFLERDGFEGWKRAPHVYPFCCWDQFCKKWGGFELTG